jgi:hypothetical protein
MWPDAYLHLLVPLTILGKSPYTVPITVQPKLYPGGDIILMDGGGIDRDCSFEIDVYLSPYYELPS